jgi:gliding motility-associated protein GldE
LEDPYERSFGFILNNTHLSDSIELIASALAMIFLLACSALISGSEVAYFSLSPNDHEEIQNSKTRASAVITALLEKPKRLLATILITNNFVNVAIVILSTFMTDFLISHLSSTTQFLIQVIVVTFLLLLLGEVIPKIYANRSPLKLAAFMAFPVYYLRTFLKPFSSILVSSTNFIDKRIKKRGHNISVNELSQALELTSDENDTDEDQKILEGIVRFGNLDVKQVMTSRVDVVSIDEKLSFSDVISIILESGYSRIPVHKDNFDNIRGVLYIKDLLSYLEEKDNFDWTKLIRKPFFVPENKKIDDLLREFQSKKTHLAIVVDEYGGSSGIISLEDILEEIVGEISDEFDDDDLVYSKLDEYNYVFEGKTSLNDVYRVLDISGELFEEEKGESESLAGFALEIFGRIPQKNEKTKFNDYLLTVDAADKRRIKRIKITLPQNQENEES